MCQVTYRQKKPGRQESQRVPSGEIPPRLRFSSKIPLWFLPAQLGESTSAQRHFVRWAEAF